ncbi:MAG: hypothetical protein HY537_00800 [Deltaproteobacteria bacterium]|nr:hypothetical protein [Deltaproteobacteria bacterium]
MSVLTSCATSGKATLLGMGIGAGTGAAIGAFADPGPKGRGRIQNVFIGAAAGGLLGAVTGYFAHETGHKSEKGKKDVEKITSSFTGEPGQPVLLPPRVEARFVDDQIRGNVFVPGHFEYFIIENAKWAR